MARVPSARNVEQVPNTVLRDPGLVVDPDAFGAQEGQALIGLGKAESRAGFIIGRQQRQVEERRAAAAAKFQKAIDQADAHNELFGATKEIQDLEAGLMDAGDINTLLEDFDKATETVRTTRFERVRGEAKPAFLKSLNTEIESTRARLHTFKNERTVQAGVAAYNANMGEIVRRFGSSPVGQNAAQFELLMDVAAGITDEAVDSGFVTAEAGRDAFQNAHDQAVSNTLGQWIHGQPSYLEAVDMLDKGRMESPHLQRLYNGMTLNQRNELKKGVRDQLNARYSFERDRDDEDERLLGKENDDLLLQFYNEPNYGKREVLLNQITTLGQISGDSLPQLRSYHAGRRAFAENDDPVIVARLRMWLTGGQAGMEDIIAAQNHVEGGTFNELVTLLRSNQDDEFNSSARFIHESLGLPSVMSTNPTEEQVALAEEAARLVGELRQWKFLNTTASGADIRQQAMTIMGDQRAIVDQKMAARALTQLQTAAARLQAYGVDPSNVEASLAAAIANGDLEPDQDGILSLRAAIANAKKRGVLK
jgi:hypothetical protein